MNLTTQEAARELSRLEGKPIGPRRIRQLCQQGRLGEEFGDRWVITLAELKRFAKIPRKGGRPKKK